MLCGVIQKRFGRNKSISPHSLPFLLLSLHPPPWSPVLRAEIENSNKCLMTTYSEVASFIVRLKRWKQAQGRIQFSTKISIIRNNSKGTKNSKPQETLWLQSAVAASCKLHFIIIIIHFLLSHSMAINQKHKDKTTVYNGTDVQKHMEIFFHPCYTAGAVKYGILVYKCTNV